MAKPVAPAQATQAIRRDHPGVEWRCEPRCAHHKIRARMAYSVTCAHLRTTKTTVCTVSSATWGNNQRTNGSMMREERCMDLESPEAETITVAHKSTGNQYLANHLSLDTAHRKPRERLLCNAKEDGFRVNPGIGA